METLTLQMVDDLFSRLMDYGRNLSLESKLPEIQGWMLDTNNIKNDSLFFTVTTDENYYFIKASIYWSTNIKCSCGEHDCIHTKFMLDALYNNDSILFDFLDKPIDESGINSYLQQKILDYKPKISYSDYQLKEQFRSTVFAKSK